MWLGSVFAMVLCLGQGLFYLLSLIGYFLSERKIKAKIFYIPFYFSFMNFAVYVGAYNYFRGRQSVVWEKSKRLTKE